VGTYGIHIKWYGLSNPGACRIINNQAYLRNNQFCLGQKVNVLNCKATRATGASTVIAALVSGVCTLEAAITAKVSATAAGGVEDVAWAVLLVLRALEEMQANQGSLYTERCTEMTALHNEVTVVRVKQEAGGWVVCMCVYVGSCHLWRVPGGG
jgi:hypothetical protein